MCGGYTKAWPPSLTGQAFRAFLETQGPSVSVECRLPENREVFVPCLCGNRSLCCGDMASRPHGHPADRRKSSLRGLLPSA